MSNLEIAKKALYEILINNKDVDTLSEMIINNSGTSLQKCKYCAFEGYCYNYVSTDVCFDGIKQYICKS